MAIAQHLNFNVTGFFHKLLNEHAVVAKRVARFVAARRKAFKGFFVIEGNAQTFTTATCRGFDHDGVTNALGNVNSGFGCFNGFVVTWNGVDLGFVGQFLGRNFVAHGGNGKVARANEGNAFVFTTLGKGFVLRQEAVTGVNGLCASGFGSSNDFVSHQIRLARGSWAQQHGFVGQRHMACFFVGFGLNGNRSKAHFLGRGNDTAGNFTAVGNQNFGKQIFSPNGVFRSSFVGHAT